MNLTIDDALTYFKYAEEEGYYSPSANKLSTMTEQEIIELAQELMDKADNYYGGLN